MFLIKYLIIEPSVDLLLLIFILYEVQANNFPLHSNFWLLVILHLFSKAIQNLCLEVYFANIFHILFTFHHFRISLKIFLKDFGLQKRNSQLIHQGFFNW